MHQRPKVIIKEIYDKSNYKAEKLGEIIRNSDWTKVNKQNCAERMYTCFKLTIENAIRKCVPKEKVFIRNDKSNLTIYEKWVTAKTKAAYRKINTTANPYNINYQKLQNNLVENMGRDFLHNKVLTFNSLDTVIDEWNFINEARNVKSTETETTSLKNSFSDTITDQKRIADLLNYRLSKLGDYFGQAKLYKNQPCEAIANNRKTFIFHPISGSECKKHVKNLNARKPLGPSEVPAWALKDCLNILAEPLCDLVNTFIQEGRFPNHLKQAYKIPVYKKGDCEDPNSYRRISVTAALAKIFEKVLREQMSSYLESNKLLTQRQFGFRSKYSTTDAFHYSAENIRKKFDNNEKTAAAFIDLSKAFDSISHESLLQKLTMLKFDDNAMSMMESFLTNRQQK